MAKGQAPHGAWQNHAAKTVSKTVAHIAQGQILQIVWQILFAQVLIESVAKSQTE